MRREDLRHLSFETIFGVFRKGEVQFKSESS